VTGLFSLAKIQSYFQALLCILERLQVGLQIALFSALGIVRHVRVGFACPEFLVAVFNEAYNFAKPLDRVPADASQKTANLSWSMPRTFAHVSSVFAFHICSAFMNAVTTAVVASCSKSHFFA